MKKILITCTLFLCGLSSMSAQQRSCEEALRIASEFLNERPAAHPSRLNVVSPKQVSEASALRKTRSSQTTDRQLPHGYYIVNDDENYRFVVVSADIVALLGTK